VRNTHSSTRGLKALVISNSPASMALWVSEAKILRDNSIPKSRRHSIDTRPTVQPTTRSTSPPSRCTTTSTSVESCQFLLKVLRTTELLDEDPTVYNVYERSNEFFCIGTLRNLERRPTMST